MEPPVEEPSPSPVADIETMQAPVLADDEVSSRVHAARELGLGVVAGSAAIGLAALAALFPAIMAGANYPPTFSLLGLHLLWFLVALAAAGQGIRMLRTARWAAAHEDEDLFDRRTQLLLWSGAVLMPLLAVIAVLTAVLL